MIFTGQKLFFAPLAGVSDSVFRSICKEHGADVVVSEMVSAEGLHYKSKATRQLLAFSEMERPIGIQLFGSNPDMLAEAADFVQKHAKPDFIDLNSGCPVPKVVKKNGGAALLRDLKLFTAIIKAMTKTMSIPLSVKIRSGWFEHQWNDREFAQAAQDAGAAALILHPRSKTMGFSGHSYWERIAIIKKMLSIPVIGNGDICTPEDGVKMFTQTKCDSIMIGRGAFGAPWLFSQIKNKMNGTENVPVSPVTKLQVAKRHLELSLSVFGERKTIADCKKHISWYTRGLTGSSVMRSTIFRAKSTPEILRSIDAAIVEEQRISQS